MTNEYPASWDGPWDEDLPELVEGVYRPNKGNFPNPHPDFDLLFTTVFWRGKAIDFLCVRLPVDLGKITKMYQGPDVDLYHTTNNIHQAKGWH